MLTLFSLLKSISESAAYCVGTTLVKYIEYVSKPLFVFYSVHNSKHQHSNKSSKNSEMVIVIQQYHTLPPVALKFLFVVIKPKQRAGNTFSSSSVIVSYNPSELFKPVSSCSVSTAKNHMYLAKYNK